ncbi:MAG: hypothetical protein EHM86_09300 [Desulfobulbaceae bacterium]|nr:MAG: hypothetical protein EHM86_09300 [Desulfobulbaceae bacterium]
MPTQQQHISQGYCQNCGRDHTLGMAEAEKHCYELMKHLEEHRTIDLFPANATRDPQLSTDFLFGEARGKMFGILTCRTREGARVNLRAFSGQFNGRWQVPGWAPPLFNVEDMESLTADVEKTIKRMGREILHPDCSRQQQQDVRRQRRELSRELMKEIHSLYRLFNFRGKEETIFTAYIGQNGIPNGTGDCCAPKLFSLAARKNLIPLGIAEFYWGRENSSKTRDHGRFYPSCLEKCQPILGFMLCGLEELHAAINQ